MRLNVKLTQILEQIAAELPMNRDRLPYTPEFDRLHSLVIERFGTEIPKETTWHYLVNACKRPRRRRRRA